MGKTILVSSHILSELEDLCDSIGIMNHGTMKLSGSMDEINTSGSQTRTIQIEFVEPFPSINDLLSEFPSVKKDSDWNDSSRLLELSHSGDSENAALLLSKLVTSGAKISESFHTKQSKVEDLFLEVESGRMEKGENLESTHPQGNPRETSDKTPDCIRTFLSNYNNYALSLDIPKWNGITTLRPSNRQSLKKIRLMEQEMPLPISLAFRDSYHVSRHGPGCIGHSGRKGERTIGLPADETPMNPFSKINGYLLDYQPENILCSFSPSPFCFIA